MKQLILLTLIIFVFGCVRQPAPGYRYETDQEYRQRLEREEQQEISKRNKSCMEKCGVPDGDWCLYNMGILCLNTRAGVLWKDQDSIIVQCYAMQVMGVECMEKANALAMDHCSQVQRHTKLDQKIEKDKGNWEIKYLCKEPQTVENFFKPQLL